MKTKITLLITSILLGICTSSNAQNRQKEKITYTYIQPCTSPIKSAKSYNTKINMTYEEAIIEDKANAKKEYDDAVANYPAKLNAAKERHDSLVQVYNNNLKEWNSKSGAGKVIAKKVLEENKPMPPGKFYPPSEPRLRVVEHEIIFDRADLTKKYFRVNGYEKGTESAIQIIVDMYGFESQNTVTTATTSSDKPAHYYQTEVRHKMNLKVISPDGTVLIDEITNSSDRFKTYKSSTYKNRTGPSQKSYVEGLQRTIAEKHFKAIYEMINNRYGELTRKRTETLYTYKSKKQDYSDLDKAVIIAKQGFNNLVSNKETAQAKIKEAIAMWEKSLEESDPSNKKARINSKVTIDIYFNIINSSIWLEDFDKTEAYIQKLEKLSISGGDKKTIRKIREFYNDLKLRIDANK